MKNSISINNSFSYLSDLFWLERKYLPLLLPILIPILMTVSPNPELNVTTVQSTNSILNTTTMMIAIKNIGNAPAENIILTIHDNEKYALTRVFNLDGSEITASSSNEGYKINLKRLSPNAHVILNIDSLTSNKSDKKISITHDKLSQQFTVVYYPDMIVGRTNNTILKDAGILLASLLTNLFMMLTLRRIQISRADSIRLQNLGNLDIQYTKFWSRAFRLSLWIVIIIHLIFLGTMIFQNMLLNSGLPASENLTFDAYVQSYEKCDWDLPRCSLKQSMGGLSTLALMSGIFLAYVIGLMMKPLPRFQWFLHPIPLNEIRISDISGSLITPTFVPIQTMGAKALNEKEDVLILTNYSDIVGLVAKNEIHRSYDIEPLPERISLKVMLRRKKIDFPALDMLGSRKNFVYVNSNQNLADIKTIMNEKHIRFAIVQKENQIIGILDYNRIFRQKELSSKHN